MLCFGFSQIVRDLIEEYRLLFINWFAGFYIIDRWGLSYPPGVSPFDKDMDDDIPFNADDEINSNHAL
jgi:hypothetical protein